MPTNKKSRKDYRPLAMAGGAVVVALFAFGVGQLPTRGVDSSEVARSIGSKASVGFSGLKESAPTADREEEPSRKAQLDLMPEGDAKKVLREAEQLTRTRRHEEAIRLLHEARPLLQDNPLAYHEMGRALMARKDYASARDFYGAAIDKNPAFADAYFGFAEASEALNDLEAALGGMRSFIHVTADSDPYRLKVAQARSAIWEWESKLGRGPWGPTKGIPPGFTAEEIKRDGKGVGIKMQKPETKREDGTMDYELKAQTKFELFENR